METSGNFFSCGLCHLVKFGDPTSKFWVHIVLPILNQLVTNNSCIMMKQKEEASFRVAAGKLRSGAYVAELLAGISFTRLVAEAFN